MNTHHRHLPRAPHGRLPNWILVALTGAVILASVVARVLVN